MQEQYIDVRLASLVFLEFCGKRAGNRDFLALEETLEHHLDGKVDVVGAHVVS